ncbi:hypothetical protein BRARA_K01913 [Brassica rapa]|uniref:DUF1985 domain-containing protein n=1 Tax=Brassica campestris TaxID=3711 RepID=A0A397KZ16_BRACM|nr:hypothetical protein BRARA_K01913 [Brassica rapa]
MTNFSVTLKIIERKLKDRAIWFKEHPQFQHIFHMPRQLHNYMALWALILRTAYISDDEWWTILNGVPLRYSIREHALYTGLCCDPLPLYFEKCFEERHNLSLSFAEKYFIDTSKVDILDVEQKLESMEEENDDLVKMALLFFIGSVFKRKKNKKQSYIDVFYLKVVDNLSLCETFPWGTLSFNECIYNLSSMMKRAKGNPNKSWSFSCFITPLELFAFEAIPQLKRTYLVDVDK